MLNSCTVAAFDVSVMCNARAQHEDRNKSIRMCVKGCKYGLGSREVGGQLIILPEYVPARLGYNNFFFYK